MDNGVGVVIRTTIIVPVVFTAMFLTGLLIANLVERWRFMSILMAGIERGIEKAAEQRAAERVAAAVAEAEKSAAEAAAADAAAAAADVVTEELRSRGVSETDIAAIVRRIANQS